MNAEEVKALLCVDHIVWNALACLLEMRPGENLHGNSSPPWNSRDIYAHFARWLNRSNAHIEAYCRGEKLPDLPASSMEMNDIWQQEDQHLTLAEARTKAGVAFTSRMVCIESVPPDKWDAELEKIVRYDGAAHYAMHINYIMAARQELELVS